MKAAAAAWCRAGGWAALAGGLSEAPVPVVTPEIAAHYDAVRHRLCI